MCGIAGWFCPKNLQPHKTILKNMADSLQHRGPDDEGFYFSHSNGIALAHRRLSIIDLSNASHQPMIDKKNNIVLIYNGELYNFQSLRRQLKKKGHIFDSQGDTEVILRSYLEWNVDCFTHFSGMFALALWDGKFSTLHLARDPMGMKPLYYIHNNDGLFFASEIKSLLKIPNIKRELNQHSVQQFLEFGYVFHKNETLLKNIHKIPPGHRLEIKKGQISQIRTYFIPPIPDIQDERSKIERVKEFGSTFQQVVKEHLVADVPVGVLLSGGLDSSLIAALAAKYQKDLFTISMGFENSSIDERKQAHLVSQYIGSNHQELLINAQQIKQEVLDGIWVFDDLFADWETISTRLLYRQCHKLGIKVALVGEGSDELFGGYNIFHTVKNLNLWQQFRLYQNYSGRRHGKLFQDFRQIISEYLEITNNNAFDTIKLFESQRQLPNNYVMKVDKSSMSESVEARTPFLDRRVAEIAYRTPQNWLLHNGENKYLLRAYARYKNLLPEKIISRKKFGASVPNTWMDDDIAFRQFTIDLLLNDNSQTKQLGLQKAMRHYFVQGKAGYSFPQALSIFRNLAWRLLLLELWSQHYLIK